MRPALEYITMVRRIKKRRNLSWARSSVVKLGHCIHCQDLSGNLSELLVKHMGTGGEEDKEG